ncbi:hypothetical protein [Sporosarcina sp. G11-34]|nr:hypothetical protein [Sporosarcina sp. G11-34]MCZ2260231.1 hypothetical protein [Sporosarcina sp. G11-34]
MGLMYATVIGFFLTIGPLIYFMMHFLSSAMTASDSTIIDPKPATKF